MIAQMAASRHYSDEDLLAYLDEMLPAERMTAVEADLRADEALRLRTAALVQRRDQGVHSIGEIWRRLRLSCPTRKQLGGYLLQTLDAPSAGYIDFHLRTIGCRVCAANLQDLEQLMKSSPDPTERRRRFYESSAGRLRDLSPRRRGAIKLRMVVALILLAGFIVAAVFALRVDTESTVVLVRQMRDEFTEGRRLQQTDAKSSVVHFVQAKSLADRVLAKDPRSSAALLFGGQCEVALHRPLSALEYFQRVVNEESSDSAFCHLSAGELLYQHQSRYREAEAHIRTGIRLAPKESTGQELLANVLRVGTRNWELIPVELDLIDQHRMTVKLMEELSRNERLSPDLGLVLKGYKEKPDDPIVLLGYANFKRAQQNYGEAETLLRKAIEIDPDLDEAHVRLGWVLLESGDDSKFLQWHANAKETLKLHPLFWAACAARARRAGEREVAARCYWEALKRDANLEEANYQLGQLLIALDRKKDAAPFLDRSAKLVNYLDIVRRNSIRARELNGKGDAEVATQAIKAASELGNVWETYAWVLMTIEIDPSNVALQQESRQLEEVTKNLKKDRTPASANPANKIDLAALPLPKWTAGSAAAESRPAEGGISFEDRAALAGIRFQFVDGSDPQIKSLHRMHQVNGGGIGVLDYDRDGWPDLYFTQGSNDPQDREQTTDVDRLFRNLGNGKFADITEAAGLNENFYSQGVAVGDVDNDGFPDLFVGNIGPNRLYSNNGDGTFSDVTETSGTGDSDWTSSCLIADVNGDSLPDLVAVGYLKGDALTRVCNTRERRLDFCVPLQFPAAKTRLWLNLGDGRFKDVAEAAGVARPNSKGVALVAADVGGSRKLDLLVGNADAPNFFFKNAVERPGSQPKFVEDAWTSGLALGEDGMVRTSLGLAAGDFNGDGLIDFHGTSASEEADTLSLQQAGGLFTDVSRASGLRTLTLPDAAFGTQAVDADLDGDLDLVQINGNTDNTIPEYVPYTSPPMVLQNDGRGRFVSVPAEKLGPYFQQKYLGRSAARLDWNRDGREDVAVSNRGAPAALLTNTSPGAGHYLTLRLVSTASARDSIGTTVELSAGGKKIVRQLTGGDGFQASNERSLTFGLGKSTAADAVQIRWMSGRVQRLGAVPADREILLVEGRDAPVVLAKP